MSVLTDSVFSFDAGDGYSFLPEPSDPAQNPVAYQALQHIRPWALKFLPTGSRVLCSPPPANTDADFLVLSSPAGASEIIDILSRAGFSYGGSEDETAGGSAFDSYRMGEVNVILTADALFFRRWEAAHGLCQRLNLTRKEDRIAVFRAIREAP